jgi:hypothetical protein
MTRLVPVTLAVTIVAAAVLSAAPKFTSVWRAPEAGSVSFAGKKIAALVISGDNSLRMSGEEALVRELTGRGLQAVATYRIAPAEELQNAERAKVWFEKMNVEGVVAIRPVSQDKRTTYHPGTWAGPNYSSLWGYYGYGWGTVYIPDSVEHETILIVETLIFNVPSDQLVWAAVSEAKNPKTLQRFVEELVQESVKELHRQGLAKPIRK